MELMPLIMGKNAMDTLSGKREFNRDAALYIFAVLGKAREFFFGEQDGYIAMHRDTDDVGGVPCKPESSISTRSFDDTRFTILDRIMLKTEVDMFILLFDDFGMPERFTKKQYLKIDKSGREVWETVKDVEMSDITLDQSNIGKLMELRAMGYFFINLL